MWLYKLSLKSFWKKNKTAKNVAPGTCVLQRFLRDKLPMRNVFVRKNYGLGLPLVIDVCSWLTMQSWISFWLCNVGINLKNETVQLDYGSKLCKIVVQQYSKGYYIKKIQSITVWSVMTKQYTAKCPYAKKSHGEVTVRRSVRMAKCLYGKVSVRQSVRTAKWP